MVALFEIEARELPDGLLLSLAGPLGREGGESILRVVQNQASPPRRLVFNFGGVPQMNTAGIGGLLWAVRQVHKAGGQVYAFGLNNHFRKVFHVMGLTQYIALVADEAAAMK